MGTAYLSTSQHAHSPSADDEFGATTNAGHDACHLAPNIHSDLDRVGVKDVFNEHDPARGRHHDERSHGSSYHPSGIAVV